MNKKLVLSVLFLLVLSAVSVFAVGTFVGQDVHCCLSYLNETTATCYNNATQNAEGTVSTNALCGRMLEGMGDTGSHLGGFLSNLAPGVGTFILLLGIFGGVVAIFYGIVVAIKKKISKN